MEKMFIYLVVLAVFASSQQLAAGQNTTGEARDRKALSVFQVVRFPNKICSGSGSYNGTCYTASECTNKGGTQTGSCASGFGVCCTFVLSCGGSASQNCTYFSSSQPAAGSCSIKICKCSSDICQLRLDFSTFVIAGPTTLTLTATKTLNGLVNAAGAAVNLATQCLTDTFSVTGPSGSVPPVICGTNTGEHMYVDSTDACNTLSFNLGQAGIGTSVPARAWSIKITQISCYDPYNLAPAGCVQYFAGTSSGMFQSYNYANSFQLANQKQRVCFRRERGFCRLCFSNASGDFQISGKTANMGFVLPSMCCGYGTDGKKTMGYDCVVIPGATKVNAPGTPVPNAICGQNLVTMGATTPTTVCTSQTPFMFSFYSDNWSMAIAATVTKGFKLTYFQTTC